MGKFGDIPELDFGKLVWSLAVVLPLRPTGSRPPILLERFNQKQDVSRRQVIEDESSRDSNWVLKGVQEVPHSFWPAISQE